MFRKKNKWNLSFFERYMTYDDILKIQKELNTGSSQPINEMKAGGLYPISKKIAGVDIEVGSICLYWISLKMILDLFDDFIPLHLFFKRQPPLQNIKLVQKWMRILRLENPDLEGSQGYSLNNEMVVYTPHYIQFKYRDSVSDSFVLYRLSFIHFKDRFAIMIRKTF